MELGMKLDNSLVHLKRWNTQRVWYKLYAYFYIKKQIRIKAFQNEEHFNYFMEIALSNNQIWKWQCKRLSGVYKGE